MKGSFVDAIVARAHAARAVLAQDPRLSPFVDTTLGIPRPFLGTGPIRLVIIGQDPTVQNARTRASITTVLTLNRAGHLRRYLEQLCGDLGLSLDQHVYATNACKCFFIEPPTTIKRDHDLDVLEAGASVWVPLLRRELDAFPEATVISLGEPVLSMLVTPDGGRTMKEYWGYHRHWKDGERVPFRAIEPATSAVGRRIYPFVHQPTVRGARAAFYRCRRDEYVQFIRASITGASRCMPDA